MAGIAKLEMVNLGVTAFTSLFQIRGKLRVAGNLQTFLNDEQKGAVIIYDADTVAYDVSGPALGMKQAELIILKSAIEILLFDVPPVQGAISFLPRGEQGVAYTDHFAINAQFFMGSDVKLPEYVDSVKQQFLSMTDVTVYPLFQPRAGIVAEAPVAVMHRTAFRMLHRI